jgi:hypothetical protein
MNHHKDKERKRHLSGITHASTKLVPDLDKDYGDSLNFIDERRYN